MTAVMEQPPLQARPWGLVACLILFVVIFEAIGPAHDAILRVTGLQALIDGNAPAHVADLLAAWTLHFLIMAIAVRLTGIPLADYLGWNRPPISDIALGVGIVLTIYGLFVAAGLLSGDGAGFVASYRAEIAEGVSHWWYVLRYWPAIFLASFVEESFFRGFLWYGIEACHGKLAALLVSSLLFAGMHYNYYIVNGALDLPSVIQYLVLAFILGWIRWRSGGTTVTIITHAVNNATLRAMVIVVSAFVP